MNEVIWIMRWVFHLAALFWIIAVVKAISHQRKKNPVLLNDSDLPIVDIIIPLKGETLPGEYLDEIYNYIGIGEILIANDNAIKKWMPSQKEKDLPTNDKVLRQKLAFDQVKNPDHLVFFVDADIRIDQSVIDEARSKFYKEKNLGLLFFPYNQMARSKNFYSRVHAHLFNICTIPVIEWFRIWGGIPGALGGAMVLRVGDIQKFVDWKYLGSHLTEDIPMALMISKAALKIECASQSVKCIVQLTRNEFEAIWHRWFIGTRFYIPKVFYSVILWMFALYVAGPLVMLHDGMINIFNIITFSIFAFWYIIMWIGIKKLNLWNSIGIMSMTIFIPWLVLKPLSHAFTKKEVVWQGTVIKIDSKGYLHYKE